MVTDPTSGKARIGSMYTDAVLGGGILFDLVASGRLALDGEGRKARVVVVDRSPVLDPAIEQAFAQIRSKGRQSPQNVVTKLGRKSKQHLYASLATKGVVQPTTKKRMGLFPSTRYTILDTVRRDDLLVRVRASLLHDQPADAESGPLIGLLSAADLTKLMVDKPERKQAKARAKVISEGDWASEGVRKAIQAAQSAISTGIIVTSIVTTAGGSS